MNKLNPVDWQYIVQSKAGKLYPYKTLEEAEEAAKRKSTKSTYSIYHEGKFVAAYAKNKKMPEWKTIYYKRMERNENSYDYYKRHKWNSRVVPYDAFSMVFDYAVDVCEEKIRIKIRDWVVTILPNGKKQPKFVSTSLSLYNTGRIVFAKGNKVTGTNKLYIGDKCIAREIFDVLYAEMLRRKPEMKQILENCRDLDELIDGYTHPNSRFITDDYKHLIRRRGPIEISACWYPSKVTNEADLIPTICKKLRVPCTKTTKKLYIRNIKNLRIAKGIADLGFKDVNNVLKLPDAGVDMMHLHDKERECVMKIARKLIRRHNENWLAATILKEGLGGIIDAARMVNEGKIDERIVDFAVDGARNTHELHDTILANFSRKPRKNRVIKYTAAEKCRFNRQYGDYKFELAIDAHDLAVVGATMGICVGGYASAAVAHSTTIVKLMRDKTYIACIEVQGDNVVQIKAKYNNPVKAEYKWLIDEWVEEAKLNVERCHDYNTIGNAWYSHYDYTRVDPRVFEERQRHQRALEIVKAEPYLHTNYGTWFEEEPPTPEVNMVGFEAVEPDDLPF